MKLIKKNIYKVCYKEHVDKYDEYTNYSYIGVTSTEEALEMANEIIKNIYPCYTICNIENCTNYFSKYTELILLKV